MTMASEMATLREMRCTGCGHLLARIFIERGTVEIICRSCKTTNLVRR